MSGDGSNMSGDELTGRPSGDVVAMPACWTTGPQRLPVSIGGVELREYLYAAGIAGVDTESGDSIRNVLRLHRFDVMSWLMQNGVAIPFELVDAWAHPEVGDQMPDKPTDRG